MQQRISLRCAVLLFVLLEGLEGLGGGVAAGEFEQIADDGATIGVEADVTLGGFGVGINRGERIGMRAAC